ncbi:flagellar export protein FliJ [Vagococcus sp.]|uniref:flagellar export protein FliJ n=1 Tax=Vagococcus sp. TaxID=1933889 RepID=UPI003F9C4345
MKKYHFSMEKVLNLRQSEEDYAKKDFLEKKALQVKEEVKLNDMIQAREDLQQSTDTLKNINDLRQQFLYKNYLEEQIGYQRIEVAQAEEVAKEELDKLVEKQKKRKMLEILKEKKMNLFVEEQKKEEQKEIDEMAVLRYNPVKI